VIVCFNFAEVRAYACVAAGFEDVCDGEERVAVDVVAARGWAVQVALYEAHTSRYLDHPIKTIGPMKRHHLNKLSPAERAELNRQLKDAVEGWFNSS
jgi:hypothetical protein